MTAFHLVYHVARADFLERTRRYGYILTLLFTVYAAYLFLPPADASYVTLHLGTHRGIYNSAWVGTLVALLTTLFLSLAGFYLVKNAIGRDRQTGVGQILAATPMRSIVYLLGKLLSNVAVLGSMVFVMIVAAGVMQLIRGEDSHINVYDLAIPQIVMTLPVMAIVGALALLFESIAFLKRGFGNIVFYVLWNGVLVTNMFQGHDMLGTAHALAGMQRSTELAFPEYRSEGGNYGLGFQIKGDGGQWNLTTYAWDGLSWGIGDILNRIFWVLIAGALLIPSVLLFDRFEGGATVPRRSTRIKPRSPTVAESARPGGKPTTSVHFTLPGILTGTLGKARLPSLVAAELRVMLKGVNRWWYFSVLVLVILGIALPLGMVRGYVLPIAAIWPILLWSGMGTREYRYRTNEILRSAQFGGRYKLTAEWIAGVLIGMVVASGVVIQFLLAGDWILIASLVSGILFASGFALGLGVWSGSGKLFEILYLILWYAGPLSKAPAVDFLGSTDASIESGIPAVAAMAGIICFILALVRLIKR